MANMTQMQAYRPYRYKPLRLDDTEIRVIHVLPGPFDAEVLLELSIEAFDTEHHSKYSYEALSYTLGNAEDKVGVVIMDAHQMCSLFVTRNCEEALRYLRFEDRRRVVWIDAICINQADMAERAQQVAIMAPIYSKAAVVVVWLGPAADNSDLAMKWIDEVGREVAFNLATGQFSALTADTRRIEAEEVIVEKDEWEAFENLLLRGYFIRLWVWQEVQMGGDNVRVICGREETSFKRLWSTICHSGPRRKPVLLHTTFPNRLAFIMNAPITGYERSLGSLDRTRLCLCADPKDRIFISQVFGDSAHKLQVKPDYTISDSQVFTSFVLQYIQEYADIEFLDHVGDDAPHGNPIGVLGLPLWVPDWSKIKTVKPFGSSFVGSGYLRSSVVSVDHTFLNVRGVVVGKIREITQFGYNWLQRPPYYEMYQDVSRILPTICPNTLDSGRISQLLVGCHHADARIPPRSDYSSFQECEDLILEILGAKSGPVDGHKRNRALSSLYLYIGRSFFSIDDESFGLGPHTARKDDILAVFPGCRNIIVLRTVEGENNRYRVIGNACCTGLMHCEAFLGPLERSWQFVRVRQDNTACYPVFRNTQTGEWQYDDPRLPPWPSEWEDVREGYNKRFPIYRHKETGEVRNYMYHPRLDADALISRGVKLQEFCLV